MNGYMYILKCSDGTFYTGSTVDLELRLKQHQNGEGAKYTMNRLPVSLVYYELHQRIDLAFYREKQVQGWSRKKKEALINCAVELLPELSIAYRDRMREMVSSRASDTMDKVSSRATDIMGKVSSRASDTIGQVSSRASDTIGQVSSRASDTIGQVSSRASDTNSKVSSGASDTIGQVSSRAPDTEILKHKL